MANLRTNTRYPVSVAGRYRTGSGVSRDVRVRDLSENGCQFFDKFGCLRRGAPLSLRIAGVGPFDAVVAWSKGQEVGIRFLNPLYGPVMDHVRTALNGRS